ncbi:heavy-metal-associated domain-containing protein [Bacteroidota bacterium]
MKTLRFKSSLKCNGCVNAIKPGMDAIKEIHSWRVFLDVQDKVIEVDFDNAEEDKIANAVQNTVSEAGYKIDRLKD